MAYDVKFYSRDNNLFIAGCSDNKIYQWDIRTGQICQEYNHHLQPCNTVTFFDDGGKFVSTSDDKKILVWEFDIPVPIKYISTVSVHPSHAFFAGQSMDNKIVVYSCGDKVRQFSKKNIRSLDTHAKLIFSVQSASTLFQGMGSGRCTSGIGKLLNVTENSMHMTMGHVWLLFGILCFRVALPHADGMD